MVSFFVQISYWASRPKLLVLKCQQHPPPSPQKNNQKTWIYIWNSSERKRVTVSWHSITYLKICLHYQIIRILIYWNIMFIILNTNYCFYLSFIIASTIFFQVISNCKTKFSIIHNSIIHSLPVQFLYHRKQSLGGI